MTPRSCSRGFRVIFAARSPRSIGSLLGLLDAATMHRTPNAGAAVIFARRDYAESSLLIVLFSKPGRCRAAFRAQRRASDIPRCRCRRARRSGSGDIAPDRGCKLTSVKSASVKSSTVEATVRETKAATAEAASA